MNCDVGEVTEGLENEKAQTIPSLHLRRSSFSSLDIKDTLMVRVVHIRNKKRNDKHGILET